MNSRERTFLAFAHQAGDRIPIDFWATTATVARLEQKLGISYGQFLDRYDVDLRYIAGPAYIGPTLEAGEDIWGVRRGTVTVGGAGQAESYSEALRPPLFDAESVDDIIGYGHWPDPDWFDYTVIEEQCDAILDAGRVTVFMGDRLNRIAQLKPAMYLRGAEEIFMDMAVREEIARELFTHIRKFYLNYTERILNAAKGKIDIVLTGDDFGAQNGTLMSPAMWRQNLRPGFVEYMELIRSHGVKTMHHTCGAVSELIPDLMACGLDILQSLQPEARGMALARLVADYGHRLCFQGGISIQKTMPYGSPADVRREVEAIADIVKPGSGYIFCTSHNIQADTPVENIIALMEAYLQCGKF